jgi:predicted nucleotidyltransferase
VISHKAVQKSVELLKKAADHVKIILFGSYARGDITEDSDLDFLIIEKEVKARRMEMARRSDRSGYCAQAISCERLRKPGNRISTSIVLAQAFTRS